MALVWAGSMGSRQGTRRGSRLVYLGLHPALTPDLGSVFRNMFVLHRDKAGDEQHGNEGEGNQEIMHGVASIQWYLRLNQFPAKAQVRKCVFRLKDLQRPALEIPPLWQSPRRLDGFRRVGEVEEAFRAGCDGFGNLQQGGFR